MEGDRQLALAVQAQIDGIISFADARPDDRGWWSRYRILIEALQRKNDFEINRASFDFHTGILGNSNLEPQSFEKNLENAKKKFLDLVGGLRPWTGATHHKRTAKVANESRQAFIDLVGVDPMDPEFKKWEAEQVARFRSSGAEETEEQRVLRKIAEEHSRK